MTIKVPGRQTLLVAEVEVTYDQLPTGVATSVVRLPVGAVVVGGGIKNVVAGNGGTSEVIDVGDTASGSAYLNDHNAKTANLYGALATKLGAEYETADDIKLTRVEGGTAATVGTYLLTVLYFIRDRATEVQTG